MTAPDTRRWPALMVLCAGMLMIILDQTILNVALPSIQRDLGFSASGLAWVVNAYLVAFGGLLLLAGRLGDLVGRRRVFVAGLATFTGASLVCGLSTGPALLIGARFVQGAGGALTSSVVLGMVVTLFPNPAERTRAIGVYSFVAAAGGAIGLLAGGLVAQALSWHWVFFVNVPIGAAALVMARRLLAPDGPGVPGLRQGADALGGALVTAALMLGVYTIVGTAGRGWASPVTLGLGAAVVALLVAFVVRQARAPRPVLPLRIFRSRAVVGANVVQMLMVAGLFGFLFLGALYLQRVLGYDQIRTGVAMVPVAVAIGALSLGVTARLIVRFGARTVLIPGLVLVAVGLAMLARAPVDARYLVDLLPVMLVLGLGGGLALPSLMTLAMADAGDDDSGLASGLVNTTQQVGGALGLAVLATLSASRTATLRAGGASAPPALPGGYHLAFVVGAGLVVAALVVAVTVLRRPAPAVVDLTGGQAAVTSGNILPGGEGGAMGKVIVGDLESGRW